MFKPGMIALTAMCALSFSQNVFAEKSASGEGIEWPPYSEQYHQGLRSGYYPRTDQYVSLLGAPDFLRKGMYYFMVPDIWYDKQDYSALMDEGFLLKRSKRQFAEGRVCDAVALGTDLHEGNYDWHCVDQMISTVKFYFRKDDPVLTGAKVKPDEPLTPEEIKKEKDLLD